MSTNLMPLENSCEKEKSSSTRVSGRRKQEKSSGRRWLRIVQIPGHRLTCLASPFTAENFRLGIQVFLHLPFLLLPSFHYTLFSGITTPLDPLYSGLECQNRLAGSHQENTGGHQDTPND